MDHPQSELSILFPKYLRDLYASFNCHRLQQLSLRPLQQLPPNQCPCLSSLAHCNLHLLLIPDIPKILSKISTLAYEPLCGPVHLLPLLIMFHMLKSFQVFLSSFIVQWSLFKSSVLYPFSPLPGLFKSIIFTQTMTHSLKFSLKFVFLWNPSVAHFYQHSKFPVLISCSFLKIISLI